MVNTKNVVPPLASIFFFFLGSSPNCARVEKFLDYKTGEELDARTAIKTPLVINPNGRVVINANAVKSTTIEMFRPFLSKKVGNEKQMTIKICVRKGKTCKNGLYVCYLGVRDEDYLDRRGRGRGFHRFNNLWDHYPSNETAKKCNDSKNKMPGFDSQLLGFKVTVKNNELEMTASFSKKVYERDGMTKDENGPFDMTYPIDEEAKCFLIYEYYMSTPDFNLYVDMFDAYGGDTKLAFVADSGCDLKMIFEGKYLQKCLGKECAQSKPKCFGDSNDRLCEIDEHSAGVVLCFVLILPIFGTFFYSYSYF